MNLRVVASLLGRGKQLERLSDGLTLLALAYGLAPLLGAPLQPLASLLCGVHPSHRARAPVIRRAAEVMT